MWDLYYEELGEDGRYFMPVILGTYTSGTYAKLVMELHMRDNNTYRVQYLIKPNPEKGE